MLSHVIDVSELVRAVVQLAHMVGDTIVQGSATAHMVSVEQADGEWKPQGTNIKSLCFLSSLTENACTEKANYTCDYTAWDSKHQKL